MEKPADIPQDVWDRARTVNADIVNDAGNDIEIVALAILSAVEEEREACAALASDRWKLWGHKANDQLCKVDTASCTDIAAAIRNRKGA